MYLSTSLGYNFMLENMKLPLNVLCLVSQGQALPICFEQKSQEIEFSQGKWIKVMSVVIKFDELLPEIEITTLRGLGEKNHLLQMGSLPSFYLPNKETWAAGGCFKNSLHIILGRFEMRWFKLRVYG